MTDLLLRIRTAAPWRTGLTRLAARLGGERAASLVEYALLVALIALVAVVSVTYFGDSVGDSFSRSGSSISR